MQMGKIGAAREAPHLVPLQALPAGTLLQVGQFARLIAGTRP